MTKHYFPEASEKLKSADRSLAPAELCFPRHILIKKKSKSLLHANRFLNKGKSSCVMSQGDYGTEICHWVLITGG